MKVLVLHQKTVHDGRKDYACDKCEKKFGRKDHLHIHQKTVHEGRKDYACDKCEKKFNQNSHLLVHQKTVHEGRKDYPCDKCEKKFGQEWLVIRHQKIVHEARKDFACDKCEKKFGEKSHLLIHLKTVHEGRKDYACDTCEKKFTQKSSLLVHRKTLHDGRKDYVCDKLKQEPNDEPPIENDARMIDEKPDLEHFQFLPFPQENSRHQRAYTHLIVATMIYRIYRITRNAEVASENRRPEMRSTCHRARRCVYLYQPEGIFMAKLRWRDVREIFHFYYGNDYENLRDVSEGQMRSRRSFDDESCIIVDIARCLESRVTQVTTIYSAASSTSPAEVKVTNEKGKMMPCCYSDDAWIHVFHHSTLECPFESILSVDGVAALIDRHIDSKTRIGIINVYYKYLSERLTAA
ncbi:unnamed protein product [Trichogramma brassicae]|uniref:C2H2-type domain-containing protein n=1 Tax=Trichogramma brassicae TaxID=86971 RepID=A0A6H5HYK8_9HYME|nr:unnamed protein product [Trichogramma brassicae]